MRSPAAQAPREPLTPQRIVDAALALVDDEGLAGFSTRRLGERLRCEAMSIYHHYPSKQHLLDAMVDRVIGSIEFPPAGGDPIGRVRALFDAYRAMAHRHPAFFGYAAVHRLNTPVGVRFIDDAIALIRTAVPDDALAARYFRAAGYYLVGAALDETSGYARGPSAAEPVDDAYIAAHCPNLLRAAPYFERVQWDATFDLGIDALLAAMTADAKRLGAAAPTRRSTRARTGSA
jgi:AcrR family transcriptional regulator